VQVQVPKLESEYKCKYWDLNNKYFKLTPEYNSNTSTSTMYYMSAFYQLQYH